MSRFLATGIAAALVVIWLLVDPRTPDLAAQVYRVGLFEHLGFAVWDEHWYAGHALPGYSLLFPPLASLLGLRVLAALSVLASAALFERLVLGVYGPAARWGAAWFAVAAVGDIWLGRLTFALGVTFAIAAVLALVRGHPRWAALLAALCAAASPVAGVLLGLAALTYALARRSPRALVVLALPAAVVVVPLALLFEEGGFEPFPIRSFAASRARHAAVSVGAAAGAAPAADRGGPVPAGLRARAGDPHADGQQHRALRGAAGRTVAAVCLRQGPDIRRARRHGSRVGASAAALSIALIGIAVFTIWGPVRETKAVAGNESTQRLLLRARPRFPGEPRRRARSGRGAAHALALGGRADGADGLARARLGEAARREVRRRAARPRADRGGVLDAGCTKRR